MDGNAHQCLVMVMMAVEGRVRALPCWQGLLRLMPLKGGISNMSFLAEDEAGRFVVRLGEDFPFHQVFRDAELAASLAAHGAGLSPELVYHAPGVMVVRYLEARTCTEFDVRNDIAGCVAIMRRCHKEMAKLVRGRVGFFWVFQVVRNYLSQLQDVAHPQAANTARWASDLDWLEAAQSPLPIVFGHHDLLPANFLHDGKRLWLIDWEYAGFGTAMFDLANLSANNQFDQQQDQILLETYFERHPDEALQRSFDGMRAASALREATWAMVSGLHLAATGIDYQAYAGEYLSRYESALRIFLERYGQG